MTSRILLNYGICLMSVGIITLIVWFLPDFSTPAAPILFTLAVLVTSLYAGLGPGLTATLLGVFLNSYLFVEPPYSLKILPVSDSLRLVVFATVAMTISYLSDARRRAEEAHRRALNQQLDQALAEVKILSGLLPICAWCKKIRDDKNNWSQIEVYIKEHSEASFTHGVCPECSAKAMPPKVQKTESLREPHSRSR